MFNKSISAPSTPEQPVVQASSKKRFGKKIYVAIVAIASIAVIVGALLIPQGAAIIPLNVTYVVGEKMVYNTFETLTYQGQGHTIASGQLGPLNGTTINATQIIEVTDFDGEYYTLNHTITTATSIVTGATPPPSFSYLEKINKQGYSTYLISAGGQTVSTNATTTNPYLTELLNLTQVKVGDTVTVPLNMGIASTGLTGEMVMTFGGFQDLTVQAGTYRVFKVDMATRNVSFKIPTPAPAPSGFNITSIYSPLGLNLTMSGTTYTEYGTMRQIKSTLQETVTYESTQFNYSMTISMDNTLAQHIIP